eukprot:CAMPEP_0168320922 /NCGR_PEP_ID=MMETSP0213-20121227/1962_1 /TAXON_ID=151035 /ORGANISM="Euplotes harpa, Strain FSP1.4" /LENGTH=139 /DNA_ID=CAMNT_0008322471 /DNA_START=11 /DNA_END=430 /DNA_ORIENTATION=-
MQNAPVVFGLGNTFIDCSAVASHELLEKYGLQFGVPGNLTEQQIPVLNELGQLEGYHEMPGGSTLNTVRAINYLMKNKYNRENTVMYFGAIAKDEKGETIKRFLDDEGILYKFDEHEIEETEVNENGSTTVTKTNFTGQ